MPGRFIVRTSGPSVREEKNCLYTIAIYNTFLKKAGNVPGLFSASPGSVSSLPAATNIASPESLQGSAKLSFLSNCLFSGRGLCCGICTLDEKVTYSDHVY